MKIRKAAEDYLESMLMLKQKNGYIRSVDIAGALGVTKPSVSYATKRLRENGFITMEPDGLISLTETGMEIAKRMYERHTLLTSFLMDIGVSEKNAKEDACKIEHDISSETFAAIRRHANNKHNDASNADFERAKGILSSYGALTVDMVEAFVRDNVDELICCNESAVLLHHKCGVHMLWVKNVNAGVIALQNTPDMHCCVTHGEKAMKAISIVKPHFTLDNPCYQFFTRNRELLKLNGTCNFRPLRMEDAQLVMDTYSMENDLEHIKKIIREEQMFGAEVEGKLAAFIGFHSDGSSGMLEVFPEYRRKGIGTQLEFFFMNYQIEKGFTPYGQVYITNVASLNMQSRIGLEVSNDYIWWTFDESEG